MYLGIGCSSLGKISTHTHPVLNFKVRISVTVRFKIRVRFSVTVRVKMKDRVMFGMYLEIGCSSLCQCSGGVMIEIRERDGKSIHSWCDVSSD